MVDKAAGKAAYQTLRETVNKLPLADRTPANVVLEAADTLNRYAVELRKEKAQLAEKNAQLEQSLQEARAQRQPVLDKLKEAEQEVHRLTQKLQSAEFAATRADPNLRMDRLTFEMDLPFVSIEHDDEARARRQAKLHALAEKYIPDALLTKVGVESHITIHQDEFAVDYTADELAMLGMFIRLCGDHGTDVTVEGLPGTYCGLAHNKFVLMWQTLRQARLTIMEGVESWSAEAWRRFRKSFWSNKAAQDGDVVVLLEGTCAGNRPLTAEEKAVITRRLVRILDDNLKHPQGPPPLPTLFRNLSPRDGGPPASS